MSAPTIPERLAALALLPPAREAVAQARDLRADIVTAGWQPVSLPPTPGWLDVDLYRWEPAQEWPEHIDVIGWPWQDD